MAHLDSIGAGMYSDLSVAIAGTGAVPAYMNAAAIAALNTDTEFHTIFSADVESNGGILAANTFIRMKNVREFPSIGTPPNIVNVPVFGQAQSQQVQGQSDAPSMEITVNYVATDWSAASHLGKLMAAKAQTAFRFTLMNALPTSYASTSAGLGTQKNSVWYWIGKIEALLVNPQLTDANTATISISVQSDFFGAYTLDPV